MLNLLRHVTLKQLRIVTAADRAGSYAAAAEAVGLTPPAITMQMRALEEATGLASFERRDGRLQPTAAGREILAAAERIEAALGDCDAALTALARPDRGRVAIGVVSTAKYFAPLALAAFARQRPEIELRLAIGNRIEIIAGLSRLAFDLAIMGRPPEDLAAECVAFGDHPSIIVAPPDHRLVGRTEIAPAELANETFLVREPGSGTRLLMERLFADAGVGPRIGMEIASNETIKQAVIAGLGLAFISAHTVAAELKDGRLASLSVRGLPIVRQWFVVRHRDKRIMPAAAAVQAFLIEEGQTFLPG